jgi:hypothetical protein
MFSRYLLHSDTGGGGKPQEPVAIDLRPEITNLSRGAMELVACWHLSGMLVLPMNSVHEVQLSPLASLLSSLFIVRSHMQAFVASRLESTKQGMSVQL